MLKISFVNGELSLVAGSKGDEKSIASSALGIKKVIQDFNFMAYSFLLASILRIVEPDASELTGSDYPVFGYPVET